jgi:UDP-3-O-[3-hydroxymyristoyl] glucosamine N-acyltransferase
LGYPAVKMETHVEMQKALRRLPRLGARVAALEAVITPSSGSATSEQD